MDTHQRIEDQEIWKCSFALACQIYSLTDREEFSRYGEQRKRVRRLMVRVLSSIIESFEAGSVGEAGDYLRDSAISLRDLRGELIEAYRLDCLAFQDFSKARAGCHRLSGLLLAPAMEKREIGIG